MTSCATELVPLNNPSAANRPHYSIWEDLRGLTHCHQPCSMPLFLAINGQSPVNDIRCPQTLLILEARRDDLDSAWSTIYFIGEI